MDIPAKRSDKIFVAMFCAMIQKVIGFRKHVRCGNEARTPLRHIVETQYVFRLELSNALVLTHQRWIGPANKP